MNNDIKVSIIVPVYNCEQYLKKCLDSLVNQTLEEIEIVLVDDGSKDKSAEICKSYVENFSNCKYIYQENGGVSKARNTGLKVAKGSYIMFSDSDDYYEKNAAKALYNNAIFSKADVVCCGVIKHFGNHDEIQAIGDYIAEGKEIDSIIVNMTENFAINQVWGKLYRSSVIFDNDIFFDETMNCGEDLEWNCRIFNRIEKISGISKLLYHYMILENLSLSSKFENMYFDRIHKAYKSMVALYQNRKMYEEYRHILDKRQAINLWNGFQKINDSRYKLSFKEKIEYIKIGLESDAYKEYQHRTDNYLKNVQNVIMRTSNPYTIFFVLKAMSYIR